MKRDLYVLRNFYDLDEFVSKETQTVETAESIIGVGFYSVKLSKNGPGVEINTTPPHLKARVLELIGAGQFSPFEDTCFFVGGTKAGTILPWTSKRISPQNVNSILSRWLVVGLVVPNGKRGKADDLIREFLQKAFQKILTLRPSAVVALADADLIAETLRANGVPCERVQVLRELVNFLVEESVHPRTAILCHNPADFEEIVGYSRTMMARSPYGESVSFHL